MSAVLSVNLLSSVMESSTYKLQNLQFSAANCRLPAATHLLLIYCYALLTLSMNVDGRHEYLDCFEF